MTAVIHHGPPGSFKSFTLVQSILIPALEAGRTVVTNIRGFNDLDKIKASYPNKNFPDTASIYYVQADSKEGFHAMATFFHWVPAGALIAMDEGQMVYPTRLKNFHEYDISGQLEPILDNQGQPLIDSETGLQIVRPSTVEDAFDQHRHYNWDIYISTPNIGKVHKEIRSVVEWAYRHRNISGILPWYRNKWREFRHDAEQSGKSTSHYSGTPKTFKADQRAFGCYQSTKTGKAKDSNENISILRDPKIRILGIVIICSIGWVISQVDDAMQKFSPEVPAADYPTHQIPYEPAIQTIDVGSHDGGSRVSSASSISSDHPLARYKLYYVGEIKSNFGQPIRFFHVYMTDDDFMVLSSPDLHKLGYFIDYVSNSYVELDYSGHSIIAWPEPRSLSQFDSRSRDNPEPEPIVF